ncbi:redoxin domain-containing protein [Thiocapsa marina]|uniref:Alkyl hydroperoxide reductase/ Thiol specific antioxidant/ Mal allergen n=1 Tax=Thiocapsa marina 5811 TaxID=768671 RepID=F9UFQ0_9GAMM|nr:redoxin domain-containing protein [Thiocapsa marina]EGV16924.1 alkyl hydroperoxide reductase/ Thiol specific antioxidant/ Mal allergen [Thiocapsa marina 5811]
MKQAFSKTLVFGAVALAATLSVGVAVAAPKVGAPAPDFSVVDTAGETWSLGGLAGKTIILEWTNHDCPYVVKHYASGNMQAVQKEATDAGYVWLSVISSASGKQGHVSPAKADDLTDDRGAAPTAVLLDTSGAMGRAYDAKTTPHMYIIDPAGTLVYMGGIDDKPTTDQADIAAASNYVRLAMADLAAGNPIATPVTRPYGCSVKY